jgi:hypothetical protein
MIETENTYCSLNPFSFRGLEKVIERWSREGKLISLTSKNYNWILHNGQFKPIPKGTKNPEKYL